ncbi:MAG TPA: hypothetical protein DEH78_00450 [Solibacterales bacterium]|nr:hypothetical protein [Bryobacterales bacterium]
MSQSRYGPPSKIEITGSGKLLRDQPAPAMGVNVSWVGLHRGRVLFVDDQAGQTSLFMLTETGAARIAPLGPGRRITSYFRTGPDELLLIDQHDAYMASVDLAGKRLAQTTINSEEIIEARRFFASRDKAHGSSAFLVGAHGRTPRGNLLCLVNPVVRSEGARLIAVDVSGTVLRHIRLELLPAEERPGLPKQVVFDGSDISLIYANGMVDRYKAEVMNE